MVGEEPFYTSETEDEIFKRLDSSGVAEAVTDAVGDAVADLVRVKEYFEAVLVLTCIKSTIGLCAG